MTQKLKRRLSNSIFAVRWLQNICGLRHLKRWIQEAAQGTPPDALVLDAGSGSAPYRDLFNHTRYETADHLKNPSEYYPPPP